MFPTAKAAFLHYGMDTLTSTDEIRRCVLRSQTSHKTRNSSYGQKQHISAKNDDLNSDDDDVDVIIIVVVVTANSVCFKIHVPHFL